MPERCPARQNTGRSAAEIRFGHLPHINVQHSRISRTIIERAFHARASRIRAETSSLPKRARSAFLPEDISRFERIINEVFKELCADGTISTATDPSRTRKRLAQRLIRLASSGWSEIQIRQLLLRAFHNEASARRHADLVERVPSHAPELKPERKSSRCSSRKTERVWRSWSTSPIWKSIRRHRLAEEPHCRECARGGLKIIASHVDHIKPHRGDWWLFVDYKNTQSLCARHHRLWKQHRNRRDHFIAKREHGRTKLSPQGAFATGQQSLGTESQRSFDIATSQRGFDIATTQTPRVAGISPFLKPIDAI
jgi:5-methylcytosine-specific restriction protein A